jgi:hypothetical protein
MHTNAKKKRKKTTTTKTHTHKKKPTYLNLPYLFYQKHTIYYFLCFPYILKAYNEHVRGKNTSLVQTPWGREGLIPIMIYLK